LDEYFEKTLTDETRKNTLKLVDELMVEEDWYEKLAEYRSFLDKLQYSDTETKLQSFHDDLISAQKVRLTIFADQNEQAEHAIDEFMNTPQMPVNIFK
jgi:predicted nucleotidyltransferase